MRALTVAVVAALLAVSATAASATDESEPPAPSTGGPVVTIPVNPDEIAELVVGDVALRPTTGLVPGDTVRLEARLAAGAAPERTVVIVDGVGEVAGDVTVDPDGVINHVFVVPELPAGTYGLSLASNGLGVAPLGTIEVVAPTAPGQQSTTTTAATAPAATPAAPAQPVSTDSDLTAALAAAGLVLAAFLVIGIFIARSRRKRSVASFEHTTPLPTATALPGQVPVEPPQGVSAGAPAEVAAVVAQTESATPAKAEPLDPTHAEFIVVEVAADDGSDETLAESIVGGFDDLDAAKTAARDARADGHVRRSDEVWWEIRRADGSAIWMIHTSAPREYDLDSESGEATPAPR